MSDPVSSKSVTTRLFNEWKLLGVVVVWIVTHAVAIAAAWYEIKAQALRAETTAKSALAITARLEKNSATKSDLLTLKEREDAIERRMDRENVNTHVRLADIQTQLAEIRSLILNNAKR